MCKSTHLCLHTVNLVHWGAVFQKEDLQAFLRLSSATAALMECQCLGSLGSVDFNVFSGEDVNITPVWKRMPSTGAPGWIAEGWAVTSIGRTNINLSPSPHLEWYFSVGFYPKTVKSVCTAANGSCTAADRQKSLSVLSPTDVCLLPSSNVCHQIIIKK